MRIVVLAGGLSPERDVSLSSGSLIANSLAASGHDVVLCDVYTGIELTEPVETNFRRDVKYSYEIPEHEPDLDALRAGSGNGDALIGRNVIRLCRSADVVFIALHGAMGENGQLQAALDCFGIKYTGTGYAGSLLAMDKDLSKQILRGAGINTAPWITLSDGELISPDVAGRVEKSIGFPCVVKPNGCGSSVGVSIIYDRAALSDALDEASGYCGTVVIEKYIRGREFSVGVLDGTALPPIEIIPKQGFYNYKNKYQAGMTSEICPAELNADENEKIRAAAENVYRALRLECYGRADFILDEATGEFVCLEANNLPGMTPVSLLPQEATAAGIGYDELCERIAASALTKKSY